ncbi:MAG: hypothetical protein ACI37Q_02280 [Candidatus Gastranaerophilaceae bacterium]
MYTYLSFADAPYMGCLPTGVAHFGGDTQVFTIPPECWAGPANNIYFNPLAQQALMPPATGFYPSVDIGSVQQAGIGMAQAITMNGVVATINSMITRCANTISSLKSRLNAMLLDEKLTDEQRKAVNDLLKRLDEQEEKLRDLQSATDLEVPERGKKAEEIEKALREIMNDMAKVKNGGKVDGDTDSDSDTDTDTDTDADTDDDNTGGTGGTGGAGGTGGTGGTGGAGGTGGTGGAGSTGGTGGHTSRVDKFSSSIVSAVDAFYDAVYCVGTDDATFEAVCGSITKDNVMDIMLAWNKYHSAEKGESFMQAFMWDADSGQKEKFGKQIARALREKAEELGIYDECRAEFAAIDKEMGSWFYISNDIAAQYDAIIKKIADKMGSKYGSPQAKGASQSESSS